MAQLILLPGKERSAFKQNHPWVFAGSVGRLEGRARPGDTVEVLADNLRPLGRAAYSPKSQIRARIWSFDTNEPIDDAFFRRRVTQAVARRQSLPELAGQSGRRLIHAESDGLPGVIADQYAMIRRVGFDGAEIPDDLAARQPEAQWKFRADWRAHDYQSRLRA